jgi:hypothetical protein
MGYRSDVAYTIRFVSHTYTTDSTPEHEAKARDSFYTFITEAKANEDTAPCFRDEDLKVNTDDLEINFFASQVKWYDDYPDVKCHVALMELSKEWAESNEEDPTRYDDKNPYIGGVYARIGEDVNDIEEECWGEGEYQWINIARSICVDWE